MSAAELKQLPFAGGVIARFTAQRTLFSATVLAAFFCTIAASKSVGYASTYPTAASRAEFAHTFANNIGLNIILGVPHGAQTVPGFTTWNTLGIFAIIGSIWGLLLSTKQFRGEEESGRLEALLVGQTTARRATAQTLLGLSSSLVTAFFIMACVFVSVGTVKTVDFSVQSGLYFALCAMTGAALFIAVGALTSQLMPTRALAARMAAAFFGLSFLLRTTADTTGAHWLLNCTPLGWIEKTQPLYHSQPIWLAPIALLIVIFGLAALWLSGKRDLGASIIADKDSALANYHLLAGPTSAALRLTRASTAGWLVAATLFSSLFGLLAKSAAEALSQSASLSQTFTRLIHSNLQLGAQTFLGMAFFMLMNILMLYGISAVAALREDEGEGYLDNFLVRPYRRLAWITGRLMLVVGALLIIGFMVSLAFWITTSLQHTGIRYHTLVSATLNALVPALFIVGLTVGVFGLWPRQATFIGYSLVAWSFMLQLLSSGLNLNHWLLDTALLHHVSLAPASDPNWGINGTLLLLAVTSAGIGILRFTKRDLQTN